MNVREMRREWEYIPWYGIKGACDSTSVYLHEFGKAASPAWRHRLPCDFLSSLGYIVEHGWRIAVLA